MRTRSINTKGTKLSPELRLSSTVAWTIGRDPKSWKVLDEFWPERFMASTSSKSSPEIDFQGHEF